MAGDKTESQFQIQFICAREAMSTSHKPEQKQLIRLQMEIREIINKLTSIRFTNIFNPDP